MKSGILGQKYSAYKILEGLQHVSTCMYISALSKAWYVKVKLEDVLGRKGR